jgi:hypothetical protein
LSKIVAVGVVDLVRLTGNIVRLDGEVPKLHMICAPSTT